jgi:hypothetical protein
MLCMSATSAILFTTFMYSIVGKRNPPWLWLRWLGCCADIAGDERPTHYSELVMADPSATTTRTAYDLAYRARPGSPWLQHVLSACELNKARLEPGDSDIDGL